MHRGLYGSGGRRSSTRATKFRAICGNSDREISPMPIVDSFDPDVSCPRRIASQVPTAWSCCRRVPVLSVGTGGLGSTAGSTAQVRRGGSRRVTTCATASSSPTRRPRSPPAIGRAQGAYPIGTAPGSKAGETTSSPASMRASESGAESTPTAPDRGISSPRMEYLAGVWLAVWLHSVVASSRSRSVSASARAAPSIGGWTGS